MMGGNQEKVFSTYSVVMLAAVKGEGTSVVVFIVAVYVEMSFICGRGAQLEWLTYKMCKILYLPCKCKICQWRLVFSLHRTCACKVLLQGLQFSCKVKIHLQSEQCTIQMPLYAYAWSSYYYNTMQMHGPLLETEY